MRRTWCGLCLAFVLALAVPVGLAQPAAKKNDVASALRPTAVANIDAAMQDAIASGKIPGGVVLVGHGGRVVLLKAYGQRSLEPTLEPMTTDTIFDLASLTKCISTATAVTQLLEQGRIRLNDRVATYLPEFAQNGKNEITIRQLVTHFSGLPPDLDLKQPWQGRETAYKMAMEAKLTRPPGSHFEYSDINFIVLGFLVEKLSGMTLDQYVAKNIYAPMGMSETRYLPPADWLPRIAPTEYDENGVMLRGVVHDPTARRMGGVAGHAGLFSTAHDLSIFCDELLHGQRILSRAAIAKMTSPQTPPSSRIQRGIGWDIDSPFSSNRGELFPIGGYGHTGFTGTSIWIDPATDTYVILLTNAVHPRGKGSAIALRGKVANAVAAGLVLTPEEEQSLRHARRTGASESAVGMPQPSANNADVLTGIDVLESDGFKELHPDAAKPVRIGLVANQTALDAHGKRTADVLAAVPGLKLAALFSPEHGATGDKDSTEIADSRDAATGAPIFSVYGATDAARRPTDDELAQVDTLVYDIQDIGVRFYTYETTLGYLLEAAAKTGKEVVVLDRPNPIGGDAVQGPVADAGRAAFVSYWTTPVRHGMTIGELARLFNAEKNIGAKLIVVPMQGWHRGDWFDATGLEWVNPSPNMRSVTAAALYPGIGMIEGTNISVGRGTDRPFEQIGAPWIDSGALARMLNARYIAGARFVPVSFTPTSSNFANTLCHGVGIVLTDRDALDAPELGMEIAAALLKLYPNDYKVVALDTLMRNKAAMDALLAGTDAWRIAAAWQDDDLAFIERRKPYLLY